MVVIYPKNKLVSRAPVFRTKAEAKEFLFESLMVEGQFRIEEIHITENQFKYLPAFEGKIKPEGWL